MFRRIVDIPFEACVSALESCWRREAHHGEVRVGRHRWRGPIERDRDSGTCRIEVRLARGPLRRPLRMRLYVDRWSLASPSTALELVPSQRVRATAGYFRAGHLLLDSFTRALQLERQIQALELPVGGSVDTDGIGSGLCS